MLITRRSPFSGKMHQLELDITVEQAAAYYGGAMLQDAFPNLSGPLREFFKSGITPEEWQKTFASKNEEDNG